MDRTVDLPFGRPVFSFVDVGERRAVGMALPLKGKGVAVNPQPPLHMVSKGEGSFEDELVERVLRFFDKEKCSAIRDEIKKRANIRNKIIYAADDGCPAIHGAVEGSIIRQSGNVGAILIALGLIDPWRQPKFPHAGIVEACISALLRIMYPQGSEGGRAT